MGSATIRDKVFRRAGRRRPHPPRSGPSNEPNSYFSRSHRDRSLEPMRVSHISSGAAFRWAAGAVPVHSDITRAKVGVPIGADRNPHAPDTETLTSPEKPVHGGVTGSQRLRASRATVSDIGSLRSWRSMTKTCVSQGEARPPRY